MNLVVVAHPDDEVLGFGATGAKLAAQGEEVQTLLMCGAADVRARRPSDEQLLADCKAAHEALGFRPPLLEDFPNIRFNTVPHVELVQAIERVVADVRPHRIFTHHPGDLNDDHGQVARACMAAARLAQRREGMAPLGGLYLMEVPSSTDWAFKGVAAPFAPNCYVEVEQTIDRKIEALGCYRDVMRPYPHPRSAEALRALATVRGAESGLRFAEAFEAIYLTSLA